MLPCGEKENKKKMVEHRTKDLNTMENECVKIKPVYTFSVTGTFHGSIVFAESEGEARRIFHKHYNGESITHIRKREFFLNNL